MIKKILQTVLFAAAFAATGLAAAAPVGYVHDLKGSVTLRDAGKQPVAAKTGDTFEQGANFTTGADGQVTLKFEDGQIAILAANTQFVAATYDYNKSKVADSNIVFNLVRGGLRFVSGIVAETNRSKFAIRTPTATAGVRGTDGQVVVSADGSVVASTSQGVVTLTVGGTTIVIDQGQFSVVPVGGGPAQPLPISSIPPALAQVAALIRAVAAVNSPPNNPVAVAATANAVRQALAAQQAAAAFQAAVARNAPLAERNRLQIDANNVNAEANRLLQLAANANQLAIQQAIAGGAAPGAGTNPGGAAPGSAAGTTPALTLPEVQILQPLVPLVVPCVPSAPATTC